MSSRGSGAFLGVLLVLAVVLHASAVSDAFIDDAYISFRYAWNLSHGRGLVFNPGEHVEGYSSLTWVLMASALLKAGIPLEAGVRGIAVTLLCLTTLSLRRLMSFQGASPSLAWLSGLLLASTSAWVLPLLNGLEGPLFSFLLLALTSLHWRNANGESRWMAVASGAVGVLLAATRPEGYIVYLAQSATALAFMVRDPRPSRLRCQAIGPATFGLGFAALSAWRIATYGSFVPNTVRAKLGPQPFARFLSGSVGGGLHYSLGFTMAILPLGLLVAGAAFWAWRRRPAGRGATRTIFGLVAVSWLCAFTVVLANNGDWMPHHRLLAPYLPLLAILPAAVLIDAPFHTTTAAVLAACLAMVSPMKLDRPSAAHLVDAQIVSFYGVWCNLGSDLQSATPSPETTIVASEVIGAFGYCAPLLRVRDLSGLTDARIAIAEPSGGVFGRKTRPETLAAMRPDAVVTNDLGNWKRLVEESDWFRRDLLSLSCDDLLINQVFAFVRKESPLATAVIASCPLGRMAPTDAFAKAACLQNEWPYAFSRDCDAATR